MLSSLVQADVGSGVVKARLQTVYRFGFQALGLDCTAIACLRQQVSYTKDLPVESFRRAFEGTPMPLWSSALASFPRQGPLGALGASMFSPRSL